MILFKSKKRLLTLLLILLFGILIFILGLGSTGLVDETPPLFATAGRVPVIAYKRGGPSEIIEHGKTGYLAIPDDKESLLGYLKILNKIDRKSCREWVKNNASSNIFASKVVQWLSTVIKENRAQISP
jgi:glycosyltransferase involved in cell wall biosynthesis